MKSRRDPKNEEVGLAAAITSETWHAIREVSVSHQALKQPFVNPAKSSNYDCWCPACRRERNAAVIGIWTSPDEGQLVCVYGICQACGERMKSLSEEGLKEEADRITEQLLRRYPFLQERLKRVDGQS